MDIDPLRDHTSQAYGHEQEARDFTLSFVGDGWLEEHLRLSGSD